MRKAGKIIAVIFASIGIVASLIVVVVSFAAKTAQEDPESFKETIQTGVSTDMAESDQEVAEETISDVADWILNLDHAKMMSQGIVGAVLSIVILVTVLINVPNMPFVTPGIATVASLGGAIYCGLGIMLFMVVALIGSGLVLLANLKPKPAD